MDTIFSPYVQNWGMIATFIGCVLSIISFIISIFVLLNTKAIRKDFLKKATIQSVNEGFRDHLKRLERVMNQKPIVLQDANKVKSMIFGSLKQTKGKLSSNEHADIDKLISKFSTSLSTESECHQFHYHVLEISSYLIETQKESTWS